MRLLWWMRTREVGHYAAEVGHYASEVGHYASSGGYERGRWGIMLQRWGIMLQRWGIMLQVVDTNVGGRALCFRGGICVLEDESWTDSGFRWNYNCAMFYGWEALNLAVYGLVWMNLFQMLHWRRKGMRNIVGGLLIRQRNDDFFLLRLRKNLKITSWNVSIILLRWLCFPLWWARKAGFQKSSSLETY